MKKSVNPLWGGRFKKKSSELLKKINNSISFDYRLANQDLKVSNAYCEALYGAKIISIKEKKIIQNALNKIKREIVNNSLEFNDDFEDIHMNIEMELKKKVGDIAGKLHTGRSRNDQVTTDLKLWIKEKSEILIVLIKNLQNVLLEKAEKNMDILMPGFTHLQNAQPILFSHYILAFFEMFQRDKKRLESSLLRLDECPLGSGALAGTNFSQIDRKLLAKKLGFSKPSENSIDSVSDRDYALEFLSNISIMSMHFSRLSEDLIIWCSSSYSFITFSDSFSTGSSIMPQKKNPDAAELIRSKTSRIYGNLISLLTTLKGLPMTYSKDLQEDKEPIFDAFDTIELMTIVMTDMIKEIILNKSIMKKNASLGFSTATDIADWLVKNTGMPFREAHQKTGEIVLLAEKRKCRLDELDLIEMQEIEPRINKEIFLFIKPEDSVNNKKSYGGTAGSEVKKALKRAIKKLKG